LQGLERTNLDEFLVYFNKRKQWINVYIYDVHPNTFQNWGGGRWAYILPKWDNPRIGKFGELHIIKSGVREDTIAHEMFHILCEYVWATRDAITSRNEERYAELLDELVRNFYKEYRKIRRK
jgi:hypothetical protein